MCRSRRRSFFRRRRVECDDDLHALEEVLAAPQTLEAEALMGLGDALAAMPESQRTAILLREWHGLSYAEIAAELGLTHSAVETLIFRARRTLAKGLEADAQPPRRLVGGLNIGSVATALKGLLGGAGATKLAAAGAVVVAASVATIPREHNPAPAPRQAARPVHVAPAQRASVVTPEVVRTRSAPTPVAVRKHRHARPAPKHTHAARADATAAVKRHELVRSLPATNGHVGQHGHPATPVQAGHSHRGGATGPGKSSPARPATAKKQHQQPAPGQQKKGAGTPSGNSHQVAHGGGSNGPAGTHASGNGNANGNPNALARGNAQRERERERQRSAGRRRRRQDERLD